MRTGADLEPLVGRDADLRAVEEALQESRLVSLTGPGGAGKTTLAQAIRARFAAEGDAWFVDASTLSDASTIYPAIAAVLKLKTLTRDPLEAIGDALSETNALLVLDNLEQIIDVAPVIRQLMMAVPGLRILTTSRVPIRVPGETEIALGLLDLPTQATAAAVEESPAGALFLLRARSIGRLRNLDERTAADVAQLLQRLDGLPLAIELAAARTRAMAPGEILGRIQQRGIAALSGGVEEDRSLLSILDWTLALLTPEQSEVLGAVAVCSGGFSLALAEALAPDIDVLPCLEALLELGLVARVEVEGTTRFRLLETIRAEALRRVSDARRQAVLSLHANAMLRLASQEWDRGIRGDAAAVEVLEAEGDNFRLALDWFEQHAPRTALVLWRRLLPFWAHRIADRMSEARTRLYRAIDLAPEPSVDLAGALAEYASVAEEFEEQDVIRSLAQRAIDMARVLDAPSVEVLGLAELTSVAVNRGDVAEAVTSARRALALAEQIDEDRPRVLALQAAAAASTAEQGWSSDEALERTSKALDAAERYGWPLHATAAAGTLAIVHVHRGEFRDAIRSAERAVALSREIYFSAAMPLVTLAMARAEMGDVAAAIDALGEAVGEAIALRASAIYSLVLVGGMAVALAAGKSLLAAQCWGCARHLSTTGESFLSPDEHELADRYFARVNRRVQGISVELAVRDGEVEDPQTFLRSLPGLLREHNPAPTNRTRGSAPDALTRREVEVFALVGQGKTDPEIARALFVSPKTVSVHVANVKSKLGLKSRLEVALRARDLGLS